MWCRKLLLLSRTSSDATLTRECFCLDIDVLYCETIEPLEPLSRFADYKCICMTNCFLFDIYRYESIIATLCESLDTLDEPEAKVLLNKHLSNLLYFYNKICCIFCSHKLVTFARHQ
jgi:hypothetical protein